MIQILTVKEEEKRQALCAKAGVNNHPDIHIIAVFSEQDEIGQGAIFKYKQSKGEILWIDMGEDKDLMIGLGKSVLSIMELRGVEIVTMPRWMESVALPLGFEQKGDNFELSLKGYFCCGCQHK